MVWNDLTLSDKARMMELAVKSGITDLRTIQEVYNKYANGGKIDEDEYYGGELPAAVITPEPVRITLITDGFSKTTPITHSSLKAPDFWISKGSDDATYNLLTANCSDATGEVLSAIAGENLTRGITTPYGLAKKVSKVFKDYPEYYEHFDGLDANQTFEVPWYEYRIAKDIVTKQRINSIITLAHKRGIPEEKINEIVTNILQESPLLNYRLSSNGEVTRVPNTHGEGGPKGDKNVLDSQLYNAGQEEAMYRYLVSRGLNEAQAAGILGNLAVESYLNADMHQHGGGPAYGLMQAEAGRQKAMRNHNDTPYLFGSKLSPEEQQQLDYIIDKGIDSYTPGEWGKRGYSGAREARRAFLNSKDVNQATDIFMYNYLRPGKPNANRRRKMANYYYEKHKDPYFIPLNSFSE